jgi:hypothetical protein
MKIIQRTATSFLVAAGIASLPAVAHKGGHDDEPPPAKILVPPAVEQKAAPHGGQMFIVDAKDGVMGEVVFAATGVELFFYDKDLQPSAPPATAKLTLTVGKEVRKLEAKLDEKKPDRLAVESPLPAEAKVALFVDAQIAGKKRTVRVQREAAKAPAPAPAPTPATSPAPAPTTTTP